MKDGLKKYLKLFLKIAVSVGALYFVFSNIDIGKVWVLLSKSRLDYLFLAAIFFALSKLLASYRLLLFFRSITVDISGPDNVRLYLLGMFYNLFLPGGIGGDGYKVYLINRIQNIKVRKVLSAVLLDRISGVSALFALALLLYYVIPFPVMPKYFAWALLPVGLYVFYFIVRRFFSVFTPLFTISFLMSLGVQFLQAVSAFLLLMALNISDFMMSYIFVFLISSIIAALTPSIGGAGTRELTFLFGSQLINLNTDRSIALSLLFYIITLVVSFTGIYYLIFPKKLGVNSYRSDKDEKQQQS